MARFAQLFHAGASPRQFRPKMDMAVVNRSTRLILANIFQRRGGSVRGTAARAAAVSKPSSLTSGKRPANERGKRLFRSALRMTRFGPATRWRFGWQTQCCAERFELEPAQIWSTLNIAEIATFNQFSTPAPSKIAGLGACPPNHFPSFK